MHNSDYSNKHVELVHAPRTVEFIFIVFNVSKTKTLTEINMTLLWRQLHFFLILIIISLLTISHVVSCINNAVIGKLRRVITVVISCLKVDKLEPLWFTHLALQLYVWRLSSGSVYLFMCLTTFATQHVFAKSTMQTNTWMIKHASWLLIVNNSLDTFHALAVCSQNGINMINLLSNAIVCVRPVWMKFMCGSNRFTNGHVLWNLGLGWASICIPIHKNQNVQGNVRGMNLRGWVVQTPNLWSKRRVCMFLKFYEG